jgi:hypothetical protein
MGPQTLALLTQFWENLWLAPKQGDFFGHPISKSNRGITQGDPLSPILFNIIVDAVVSESRHRHPDFNNISTIFYADDGLISGLVKHHVQQYLDTIVDLFQLVGLRTNVTKTQKLSLAELKYPTTDYAPLYTIDYTVATHHHMLSS